MISTNIHQSKMLDDKTGTLLVSISYGSQEERQNLDAAELVQSISRQLDNELIPLANSFVLLNSASSATTDVVVCKVAQGISVLPYTQQHTFTSVSANLFMDDSENFWSLSEIEGKRVFIKDANAESREELATMMKSVSHASHDATTNKYIENAFGAYLQSLTSISATDLVTFVKDGKMCNGLVGPVPTDSSVLYVCDSSGYVEIEREAVVAYLSSSQFLSHIQEPQMQAAFSSTSSAQKLMEYFTKVYGFNQEYLNKLISRMNSHTFS